MPPFLTLFCRREAAEWMINMFEQVKNMLASQLDIDADEITLETSLADDLGADSLDAVELIMALEDTYGVAISDEEAAQLTTVGKIVEYLEKLR